MQLVDERTREFRDADGQPDNAYKGLPVHALPGLHAHIAAVIEANVAHGASMLDLAAGTGALTLRLADLGYRMHAAEYVRGIFRPSIPCEEGLDLNTDFAAQFGERFDAIVAAEIIEHLENPRHFLRQCARLLAPRGKLILTTPNITSPASKAMFVRDGWFAWHSPYWHARLGHISPITPLLLMAAAREAKLATQLSSFGDAGHHFSLFSRRGMLARLLSLFDKSKLRGDILVAVMTHEGGAPLRGEPPSAHSL